MFLAEAKSEEAATSFARDISNLSKLIQLRADVRADVNLEIAITGCKLALTVFTRSRFPVEYRQSMFRFFIYRRLQYELLNFVRDSIHSAQT